MTKLLFTFMAALIVAACKPDQENGQVHKRDREQVLDSKDRSSADRAGLDPAVGPQHIIAAQANPENHPAELSQGSLKAPKLNRTTVVITNGFEVPIHSYWLKYDPSDSDLQAILKTMQKHADSDLRFVEAQLADNSHLLCVTNPANKAAYLGSLWQRLARLTAGNKVQVASLSYNECDMTQPADFSFEDPKPSNSLQALTVRTAQWLCQSETFPDHTLRVLEWVDAENEQARAGVTLLLNSKLTGVPELLELDQLGWFRAQQDDLGFSYQSALTGLTLTPYQPSSRGGVRAVLQQPGNQEEIFSCEMKQ